MTPLEPVIFLVSADRMLPQQLIRELLTAGAHYQLPLATSVAQAREGFQRVAPAAILLDETALARESLESAAALLCESAPVVVVAAPERQEELTFLITSGAVDFVARVGNFLPIAMGLLERRARIAQHAAAFEPGGESARGPAGADPFADFGEILRHEVNNPLTGILGNAELLLAEYRKKNGDAASSTSLERLQAIADLAVRLRETVRRLSNAWESWQDHVRQA